MTWAPSYVTTAELKAYVKIPLDDVADDTNVAHAIAGASRAIDRLCKRQFGKVASAVPRIYTPRYHPQLRKTVVDTDDLMDVTGLVVSSDMAGDGGFATTVTAYTLGPVNAAADGRPWSLLVNTGSSMPLTPESVRVTALWGWTAVPEAITQACLIQSSRFLSRRDSPYGVAGDPAAGSELRLLAKVDPDVAVIVRDYTRRWYAV